MVSLNTYPGESSESRGVLPDWVVIGIPDGVGIDGGLDVIFQSQTEEEQD